MESQGVWFYLLLSTALVLCIPSETFGYRKNGKDMTRNLSRNTRAVEAPNTKAAKPVSSEDCTFTYTEESGIFTSLNYPENYDSNLDCTWTILTTPGKRVRITFLAIDIENQAKCGYDFVQILNYKGENLGIHCGPWPEDLLASPDYIVESPHNISVVFHSDIRDTDKGFKAKWETIEPEEFEGCQGEPAVIDGNIAGEITSPGYPNYYQPYSDCVYNITIDQDKFLQFDFHPNQFDIEYDPECKYDYMDILDEDDQSIVGGKLCGNGNSPSEFPGGFPQQVTVTASSSAIIHFHSDRNINKKGFRISYTPIDMNQDPCSGGTQILTGETGIFNTPNYGEKNYERKMSCKWLIQVAEDSVGT